MKVQIQSYVARNKIYGYVVSKPGRRESLSPCTRFSCLRRKFDTTLMHCKCKYKRYLLHSWPGYRKRLYIARKSEEEPRS